jgi:hypothetical protein
MKHWLYSHPFKSVSLFAEDDVVEIDELYKIHTYEKAIGQFSDWDEKEGVWVFGAINRDNTKLFMTTVSSRRTEDLIPLLYVITEPNTTIVSDALSTYYQLSKGFDYHCINKKKDGFSRKENAEGGGYFTVTVNHIENRWRSSQRRRHSHRSLPSRQESSSFTVHNQQPAGLSTCPQQLAKSHRRDSQ